jgi:hypothetical protein
MIYIISSDTSISIYHVGQSGLSAKLRYIEYAKISPIKFKLFKDVFRDSKYYQDEKFLEIFTMIMNIQKNTTLKLQELIYARMINGSKKILNGE